MDQDKQGCKFTEPGQIYLLLVFFSNNAKFLFRGMIMIGSMILQQIIGIKAYPKLPAILKSLNEQAI